MTKDRDFKDLVRAEANATGERYTEARERLLADAADSRPPRVIGVETRYRVVSDVTGRDRLSDAEVAAYVFRRVVSWGRSSNVYLPSGSRVYLLQDGLFEYATPECDGPHEAVANVAAGHETVRRFAIAAVDRLRDEGLAGTFTIQTDRSVAGGAHESYLMARRAETDRLASLVPFLASRSIIAGPGSTSDTAAGRTTALTSRSDHTWNAIGGVVPHMTVLIDADPPPFGREGWRLHVPFGESNRSQHAEYLKLGATDLVVRLIDEAPSLIPDLALGNPVRAVREFSHDLTGKRRVQLAARGQASAVDLQRAYLTAVTRFLADDKASADDRRCVDAWSSVLQAIEDDDTQSLAALVDWTGPDRSDPVVFDSAQPERDAPLGAGALVDGATIEHARTNPPATTRARLRGEFISACTDARRDYTVDWTHLKLNDEAQRTIVLNDARSAEDERVERLLAAVRS